MGYHLPLLLLWLLQLLLLLLLLGLGVFMRLPLSELLLQGWALLLPCLLESAAVMGV